MATGVAGNHWFAMALASLGSAELLRARAEFARSAINRSYYAMYQGIHALAMSCTNGPTLPERGNWKHKQCIGVLHQCLQTCSPKAGVSNAVLRERFERVQRLRELADYDPAAAFDSDVAKKGYSDATILLRYIEGLLGDSA